ncbi:MAG: LysR family transcriptional regulator [Solirubrobacterales bacterium]|nr:LysR family transcriptional regulator [Solirubrobacterales bacterium]
MELRQLEYFAAVARHRHFRRAAEEVYVTQSALSQQVRRLEEELGLLLLRRTPHGVELTEAGADLAARAEAVLAQVAEARAAMDGHAGAERGVARIAATAADAPRLPEALAAFHRAHPGLQVALRQGSAAEVVDLLRRGAVDLAVTGLRDDAAADLEVSVLAEEPLRLLVPLDDPLADRGTVAIEDLRGAPLILAERHTALRDAVGGACAAAGFSPVPLFEVGDPATVRFLVHAGLGVSAVPASWLDLPGPAVAVAELAPPVPTHRVGLLALSGGTTPAGRLLAEHVRLALARG